MREEKKIRKVLKWDREKKLVVCEEREEGAKKKKRWKENFLFFLSLSIELGFRISLPIAGGVLLGRWLDQRFNSAPKLTLSFIFLGVFLGISNLYQIIKITAQERAEKE